MQFNQITYFLRTCDTLNFTRAAEICHVSQPSLSTSIQKLEEELGGELFSRQGRHISLTPLGLAMRTHLGQIEQAKNAVKQVASEIVQETARTIDVGLMCTLSPGRLLKAIGLFGEEYPDVELLIHDIWGAAARNLLVSGALDCVVIAHVEELPERFSEHSLATEPMLLAMNDTHPLCARDSIALNDLQGVRYVDRLNCEFRDMFFMETGAQGIHIQTVMRSEREDLVRDSITEGVGVSIVPQSVAVDAGLQNREISDMKVQRKISLMTVKDAPEKPELRRFIRLVCNAYK